jgi:molybdopterin-guanine dinucleotide biosynthesis protein A
MISFESKRNQVYPVLWRGRVAVEKHFTHQEDWHRETELYRVLSGRLPVPSVLEERPNVLVTEFFPYLTLLQVLEEQERKAFSPDPWIALASWLKRCYSLCGKLPLEGNLRNFLWDNSRGEIVGLDLESYEPATVQECGAEIIGSLITYAPEDTSVKNQIVNLLAVEWNVSTEKIAQAKRNFRDRRQSKVRQPLSGIILAGGKSRRMGQDKGSLDLRGKTFLQRQVEKLQTLGVEEILLSGDQVPELSGTTRIADLLPERGPLGGLHACLQTAKNPVCMVLTVDMPLVPLAALDHLRRAHREGITVLCHRGREEPLVSVMDRHVAYVIEPIIAQNGAPVKALKGLVPWNQWEYLGPEDYLRNCNTPAGYEILKQGVDLFARLPGIVDCF